MSTSILAQIEYTTIFLLVCLIAYFSKMLGLAAEQLHPNESRDEVDRGKMGRL